LESTPTSSINTIKRNERELIKRSRERVFISSKRQTNSNSNRNSYDIELRSSKISEREQLEAEREIKRLNIWFGLTQLATNLHCSEDVCYMAIQPTTITPNLTVL